MNLKNLVMASPDTGGSKRANAYAKFLDTELVICHKTRKKIGRQKNALTAVWHYVPSVLRNSQNYSGVPNAASLSVINANIVKLFN